MRRCSGPWGGRTGLALGAALSVVVSTGPAHGAPAAGSKQPPAAPRGWVVDHVRFEPLDPATPLTAVGAGDYRGAIEVVASGGGVATINDVGLEDYLRGISEVPPTWPAEALKAQAIAARTYAVHQIESTVSTPFRGAGANICDTDSCQVYTGMERERQGGAAAWNAAVAATAGQVVLYNGKPIFAEYSSSNGGRTVAGAEPYLRSVADPDDAASPLHHWHYTAPVGAFAGALGVTPPNTVASVSRSGEAIVYTVQSPPPTTTTTAAPPGKAQPSAPPPPPPPPPVGQSMAVGDFVAKANGGGMAAPAGLPLPFPTGRFSLSSSGDTATVDGGGWGHGVGMSQYGAYGKAQRGMKAADILAAYYGGLRPVALGPPELPARIRVALNLGQGGSSVTAPARFRVLDGAGHPLALIALGRWDVTPAGGGKVRVIPPEGYDKPLAITPEAVEPALGVGVAATLRYRISTPAIVRFTMVAPGAKPVVVDSGVVDAGEAAQPLPPPPMGGAYQIVIDADAGPGRVASLPVTFSVAGPARTVIPSPALLAAPRGEALWTRTVTAWRSFPTRLPLVLAGLLLLLNASFLGVIRARARQNAESLD